MIISDAMGPSDLRPSAIFASIFLPFIFASESSAVKMSNARAGKHPRRNSNALERTSLELLTLQHLRTVFGSARTHDGEVRRAAGISGSQLCALAEIAASRRRDGITVNGLTARMALHQTTTSNLVNALTELGLIRRERDSADQRIVHLHFITDVRKLLVRTPDPHVGLPVDALRCRISWLRTARFPHTWTPRFAKALFASGSQERLQPYIRPWFAAQGCGP